MNNCMIYPTPLHKGKKKVKVTGKNFPDKYIFNTNVY